MLALGTTVAAPITATAAAAVVSHYNQQISIHENDRFLVFETSELSSARSGGEPRGEGDSAVHL